MQLAGTVLAAFRKAAFEQPALDGVATELDRPVRAVAGDEDFVTALLVEFRPDGTVRFVNCGHHPPLLLSPHGVPPRFVDTGEPQPPLGLGVRGTSTSLHWSPEQRMLLYTDGLVEARDRSGGFFPLTQWAPVLVEPSLDGALQELLAGLRDFSGAEVSDDVALLLAENVRR